MPQDFAKILDDVCFTPSSIFKSTEIFFWTENTAGETPTVSFIKQKETRTTLYKGQMNSKRTTEKLARGGL